MVKINRSAWLALLLTLPMAAYAAGFNLAAGPSVTSSRRLTGAVFANAYRIPDTFRHIRFEPVGSVGWVAPHHQHKEHLHHAVLLAGGGVRITFDQHWFASEQIAATSNTTDALSSRFEFMSTGGWQDGHFVLLLRHISNGHIVGHGKNLGETMLLAGLRW
jgi:hypothetical protein